MIEEIIPVLQMMLDKGEKWIGGADHDVIYGPPLNDISPEQRKILLDNNWTPSDECNCWVKYV